VLSTDEAIAWSILSTGHFQVKKISDVVAFLSNKYGFSPRQFIDIGANIGTHLLFALSEAKFEHGIAFEMDNQNFRLLECNVILRGLSERVRLFNVALSDEAGFATMERSPTNFGDHRIRSAAACGLNPKYNESSWVVESVETATVDGFFSANGITLGKESLIWMDTQGHEGHILRGGKILTSGDSGPFLVTEFWPYGLNRSGGVDLYFESLATAAAIFDINLEGWESREPTPIARLKQIYEDALQGENLRSDYHTDLLCIPCAK